MKHFIYLFFIVALGSCSYFNAPIEGMVQEPAPLRGVVGQNLIKTPPTITTSYTKGSSVLCSLNLPKINHKNPEQFEWVILWSVRDGKGHGYITKYFSQTTEVSVRVGGNVNVHVYCQHTLSSLKSETYHTVMTF